VIALRALASTTETDAGQTVPYFLMPSLGGSSELRGYPTWRFRDRNRILFTGEYRWTAGQFVDMAVFFDAGKVAARRTDLDQEVPMPESYGKRERRKVQERKAALRDERRAARRERRQAGPAPVPELELLDGPAPQLEDAPNRDR